MTIKIIMQILCIEKIAQWFCERGYKYIHISVNTSDIFSGN
jgi:hypothetical protein